MHARVWHVNILPHRLEDFKEALRSFVPEAKNEEGFRGYLVLRTDKTGEKPEALLISLWNSEDHLRQSDNNLFLTRAIAQVIGCCDGFPLIQEHEVLLKEFA
jgi:quinol monooxygenase YgiN